MYRKQETREDFSFASNSVNLKIHIVIFRQAYGKQIFKTVTRARCFEWRKRFKNGRTLLEDEEIIDTPTLIMLRICDTKLRRRTSRLRGILEKTRFAANSIEQIKSIRGKDRIMAEVYVIHRVNFNRLDSHEQISSILPSRSSSSNAPSILEFVLNESKGRIKTRFWLLITAFS